MNANKLNRLFTAARLEKTPGPGGEFAAGVMRAVGREPVPAPLGIFAQLGEWFPRLAIASAALIMLFLAADLCASALGPGDIEGGVAQISEQWLFAAKGF